MGKIYKHKYEAWEKPEGDIDLLTSYIKDFPGENITDFFSKLKSFSIRFALSWFKP